MSVYKVVGVGSEMEIFEDKLTITPKGFLGLMNTGPMMGTKTIPFSSITATRHKKAVLGRGYLQFTLPDGDSDENRFIYRNASERSIEEIKEYIEKRIRELKGAIAGLPADSVADELTKLAKLKEQGILSEEEFVSAKGTSRKRVIRFLAPVRQEIPCRLTSGCTRRPRGL